MINGQKPTMSWVNDYIALPFPGERSSHGHGNVWSAVQVEANVLRLQLRQVKSMLSIVRRGCSINRLSWY